MPGKTRTPAGSTPSIAALGGQKIAAVDQRGGQAPVVLGPDIHPATRLGSGIMLDHGSGIVIGETAIIGDDVSILQNGTLAGTGKDHGDRHP